MTSVSFYVLPSDTDASRLGLVATLAKKAYEAQEPTLIYCDDEIFMHQIDQAIWALEEEAFIPHTIIKDETDINEFDFIYLSHKSWDLTQRSLLINLSHHIPSDVTKFERVFEIITTNPKSIEQSRERYRTYRAEGFEIQTHKL